MNYKAEIITLVERIAKRPDHSSQLEKLLLVVRRFVECFCKSDYKPLNQQEAMRMHCHTILNELPADMVGDVHYVLLQFDRSGKDHPKH